MHTPPETTTLATLPWPHRVARLAVAVLAIALSARVATTLPGSSVPQSAQTLAVLLAGAFLGARDGSIALVAYLLLGGAGVPVFADGASGWAHLVGPTAGYLVAFALSAGLLGWLSDLGRLRGFLPALAAMLGATRSSSAWDGSASLWSWAAPRHSRPASPHSSRAAWRSRSWRQRCSWARSVRASLHGTPPADMVETPSLRTGVRCHGSFRNPSTSPPRMRTVPLSAILVSVALLGACAAPEDGGPAQTAEAPPALEAEVLAFLESYYDAFSSRDWAAFQDHFWPDATLTTAWMPAGETEERVVVTSVSDFVAQAPQGPGSREVFEERMVSAEIRGEGDLAQAWTRYRARFGDPGDIFEWQGVDAFTLFRHQGMWKIASLVYASDEG